MSTPIVRVGDINSAGGVVTQGHSNITVNGKLLAIKGSPVTPHPCCPAPGCSPHCSATAAYPGSSLVTANGIPVLRVNVDKDSCGHPRATGSPNVTSK